MAPAEDTERPHTRRYTEGSNRAGCTARLCMESHKEGSHISGQNTEDSHSPPKDTKDPHMAAPHQDTEGSHISGPAPQDTEGSHTSSDSSPPPLSPNNGKHPRPCPTTARTTCQREKTGS